MMDLATAAQWTGGAWRGRNVEFARVSTDSRIVKAGDLFIALTGDTFDGHAFVAGAQALGAVAAMVAAPHAPALPGNLLVVADTLAGLQSLSAQWRRRFSMPLIVVTGSNGKTTVKEMTAAILRAALPADTVLATRGNFNNGVGLPLTLLELRATHRAAVVELGMNHRGETRELAALAQPTITVVNNAQREHQEFMVSVDAVADEHADAIRALPFGGYAIINADDERAQVWRDAAAAVGARVVSFGLDRAADVHAVVRADAAASDLTITTPAGTFNTRLGVPGMAMARNALAATAAALTAGAPLAAVAAGLAAFRPVGGRLARSVAASGAAIIDDSYNANPDSVRAAIDVLARATSPRWLVLGDMGEVGDAGPALHREVGDYARSAGIERLFATGALAAHAAAAFGSRGEHYADTQALLVALRTQPPDARTTVLVKGSRFMHMERLVAALDGRAGGGGH